MAAAGSPYPGSFDRSRLVVQQEDSAAQIVQTVFGRRYKPWLCGQVSPELVDGYQGSSSTVRAVAGSRPHVAVRFPPQISTARSGNAIPQP